MATAGSAVVRVPPPTTFAHFSPSAERARVKPSASSGLFQRTVTAAVSPASCSTETSSACADRASSATRA